MIRRRLVDVELCAETQNKSKKSIIVGVSTTSAHCFFSLEMIGSRVYFCGGRISQKNSTSKLRSGKKIRRLVIIKKFQVHTGQFKIITLTPSPSIANATAFLQAQ